MPRGDLAATPAEPVSEDRSAARAVQGPDDIRRFARVVGLRDELPPTLEAVERRRLHLWVATTFLLVAVAVTMALVSMWMDLGAEGLLSPTATRLAILGLVGGFCAYAVEKELHLRRLSTMLVEERVLTSALANRLRELESLLEAGKAVNSVLQLEEVLRIILGSAIELLRASAGSVMLLENNELRSVCVRGNEFAHNVRQVMGEGIAGRVAATGQPLLINGEVDDAAFPGHEPRQNPVLSAMSVPLIDRGVLVGVLNINAAPSRTFTEYDLRALSLFGEHAASAIAKARLYEAERLHASELAHQAFHDSLTGIANRALFEDRLQHALLRSTRTGERVGVLFMDLDDFKRVNDSLGHAAGDELLALVAKRIDTELRAIDTAARFGGDEFVVLLEDIDGPEDALQAAERLLAALRVPFELGGRSIVVRGTIGVAMGTAGDRVHDLLHSADVAMYLAKEHGKDCVRVFEERMHEAVLDRLELESDIEHAIERGEFAVHYQPVVDLATSTIIGVEALLRWTHPVRGSVPPASFVPLAEQTGLVGMIDRWVLETACRQAQEWVERGGALLSVSVNFSTRTLENEGIVEEIGRILDATGLDPNLLTLEITESFVLQDRDASVRRLAQLRDLGVRLAIDDFGTGWSSLSYLKQLPVNTLKIDRSFIDGLDRGAEDAALVQAIVKLGRSLHLELVAEGIERPEQIHELRRLRCRFGQGFHFSPAVPPGEIESMLEHGVAVALPVAGS